LQQKNNGQMKLITPRLVLREMEASDLEALHAVYNDSPSRQYEQSLNKIYSIDEIRDRIQWDIGDQSTDPRTRFRWALTIKPDNRLSGWISLRPMNPGIREWEIGWSVRRDEWGKGYASEGARAVMRFAFEQLQAHRLVAFCHAENAASARVMEKLGMKYEGTTRGTRWLNDVWTDELIYSILEGEFV
jgi:[ribosomal protein S5]-alanine N-acetyltransferase